MLAVTRGYPSATLVVTGEDGLDLESVAETIAAYPDVRATDLIEAVALGRTTPNEISGATGIDPGPLSKYLQTLRRLRLIDREVPVTASGKKSKRSRYRVADEFLRFWFRYVEPNRSSIEEAPSVVFDETIEPDLPSHVATTFEDICRRGSGKRSDAVTSIRTPKSDDGGTAKRRSISSVSRPATIESCSRSAMDRRTRRTRARRESSSESRERPVGFGDAGRTVRPLLEKRIRRWARRRSRR